MRNKDLGKDLALTIKEITKEYRGSLQKEIDEAAKEMADKLLEDIRRDAPVGHRKYKKRRRHYRDSGEIVTTDGILGKKFIWRTKPPNHALPHLLEHGHRLRKGGRTRAFPHIVKNERIANEEFYKKCVEIVERANKDG